MYLRQDQVFGQRRNPGTCPVRPPVVSFIVVPVGVSCLCGEQRCGPAFCDSVPHSTLTGLIQPHPPFSQSLPFLYPLIAAYLLPPSHSINGIPTAMASMFPLSQRLRSCSHLSLGFPRKIFSHPPESASSPRVFPLPFTARHRSFKSSSIHQWRSSVVLDSYVEKPARPISLRQLIFFGGRNLDERRIIDFANYVRSELPIRIAHRIRDMQKLPYVVVTNRHLSEVYELYYSAFDAFRKIPEIGTVEDNDNFCQVVKKTLKEHLTVIPSLAMGVLECRDLVPPEELDRFMNRVLRSVWRPYKQTRVFNRLFICLTNTVYCTADLPSSDSRTTSCPHGYLQLSFSLP